MCSCCLPLGEAIKSCVCLTFVFTFNSVRNWGLRPFTAYRWNTSSLFPYTDRLLKSRFIRTGSTETTPTALYRRLSCHQCCSSFSYHTATHFIPCSVNGVGPQRQMRTLDVSELLFKNSDSKASEMYPCLPLHSEVGAERTNSTSNLERRNISLKCLLC